MKSDIIELKLRKLLDVPIKIKSKSDIVTFIMIDKQIDEIISTISKKQ